MRDEKQAERPNGGPVSDHEYHSIVGMEMVLTRMKPDSLPRHIAAGVVADAVKTVRAIDDPRIRQLALFAVAECSYLQQPYRAELARQAPDLVGPSDAAHAAVMAERPDCSLPAIIRAGMLRAGIGAPEAVAAAQASMRGRGRH